MRKVITYLLFGLFLIFGGLENLFAGVIKGRVVDSNTGDPLLGANVIIEELAGIGGASDLKGFYRIDYVPAGEYTLKVTYIGYQTAKQKLIIRADETITQNFNLIYGGALLGEEVVVTAQAKGQMSAINQQLASNTITSIVDQSRIQELPDVNAAESIGRLPGISIQRYGGEATKVEIRGLSPKYNMITVNGVRVPATGGDDRSVDLSLISSNMLGGIEVKKAVTPDMDADALGGTVDLKVKEAPENLQLDFASQGGYNQLQNYTGNYKLSGTVSNRFSDNRLGILANFNLDDYDRSADKLSANYGERTNLQGETYISMEKLYLRENILKRGRTGASILLDYRLPNGKITANSFYNQLGWDGTNRINIMSLTAPGESNRHYYEFEERGGSTSIFTGALGVEQNFGWIRYDASLARTASRTRCPDEKTWRFTQEAGAFTQTEFPQNTDLEEIPAFATNDTFKTFLSEVWLWDTEREENESSIQFNFQMPFNVGNMVNGYLKTGGKFRWLERLNDEENSGRHGIQYGDGGNEMLTALDGANPDWQVQELVDEHGHLPISIFLDNYSRANFLDGDYPLGFTVKQAMLERVTQVLSDSGKILRYSINSLGNDYHGRENYQAGYLMAEFNLGRYLTILPGIRYENEYSKYYGQRFKEISPNNVQGPPADLDTLTNIRRHEFWLPAIHLTIKPTSWLKIRLARTATLTRPDYIQYAPITRINSYQSYMRAANALLKPAESTNYDASVSVYQNHIGLFTISGFYKEIENLIFQTRYEFKTGVPVPVGCNIPEDWLKASPQADIYINNPYPAYYRGVELDWQTHFWYLPSLLKGIILNVNYTHINSEMKKTLYITKQDSLIRPRPPVWSYKIVDSTRTARMPDQPAHILNLTIGCDYKGFSMRLSYLYQTDKVTYIDRNTILDQFTGDYARWDLSLQQKLSKKFQLFANFNNLNSRPDRSFRGEALVNPTYIEYYGFTMDFGIRYKI